MKQLDLIEWAKGKYTLQALDHSCSDCLEYSNWLRIESDYGDGPTYECVSIREDDVPCGRIYVDKDYEREAISEREADFRWDDL